MTSALSTRRIVITGVLAAVAILLGITRLGFIPVPNVSGNATIMHVPAIIGGVLEGPLVGLLVGGIFGLFSWLQATSPLFANPLVSVLPRLFIGVTAALTNTILVLGMAIILGLLPAAAVAGIIPQAIAEMIIAAIITVAVVAAWK